MQTLLDQPMAQAASPIPATMHSSLQNTLQAQMQTTLENAMQANTQTALQSSLQGNIEASLPTPMQTSLQTQIQSSLQNQLQASISTSSSMDKIEDLLESLQKQWLLFGPLSALRGGEWYVCSSELYTLKTALCGGLCQCLKKKKSFKYLRITCPFYWKPKSWVHVTCF